VQSACPLLLSEAATTTLAQSIASCPLGVVGVSAALTVEEVCSSACAK